jgi:general secretion pathway protein B
MSYILDALRKSDQLRRRGAAPTLLLGQAAPAAPKRPALLSYGVPALVLLGAGMAIGWLRPWQPEPAVPAPTRSSPMPTERGQSPAQAALPTGVAPKAEQQAQNPAPAAQAAPAPAPVLPQSPGAAGVKTERQGAPPRAAVESSNRTPAPEQAPGASSGAGTAAALPSVVAMAELPVAIQQELPPISISVHAYSDKAAERLVGINSRLLHEGDYVAPDLRLEQITPDGMILSYKGYTFRRGVH